MNLYSKPNTHNADHLCFANGFTADSVQILNG